MLNTIIRMKKFNALWIGLICSGFNIEGDRLNLKKTFSKFQNYIEDPQIFLKFSAIQRDFKVEYVFLILYYSVSLFYIPIFIKGRFELINDQLA